MSDQGHDDVKSVSNASPDHASEQEVSDAENDELLLDLGSGDDSISYKSNGCYQTTKLLSVMPIKGSEFDDTANKCGIGEETSIVSQELTKKSAYVNEFPHERESHNLSFNKSFDTSDKIAIGEDEEVSEVGSGQDDSVINSENNEENLNGEEKHEDGKPLTLFYTKSNDKQQSKIFANQLQSENIRIDDESEYTEDFEDDESADSTTESSYTGNDNQSVQSGEARILFRDDQFVSSHQCMLGPNSQESKDISKILDVKSICNNEDSRTFQKLTELDELLCFAATNDIVPQKESDQNSILDWVDVEETEIKSISDELPQKYSNHLNSKAFQVIQNSTVDDQFDLIDVPIPIEQQIPHLPTTPLRAMGLPLTRAQWDDCFVSEERRLDPHRYAAARAVAYAGGIEEEVRMQVWHHLLHVYSDDATQAQRDTVRVVYEQMYEKLTLQWTNVFPEQERRFATFRELHSSILKDVVRTDRAHPAHADDDSVKQQMLRNVLMAHGMFNFDLGYSQGMSDMLSVIALLTNSEAEAFTCFSCLLTDRCESNFRRDVRVFMGEKLVALQTLLRHFVPKLHAHLVCQHADDMSFCFRWLLMLFKREFSINDTMLLWDVIFSCPYTPQFELFVAAALLKALSPQILQQHLAYDELLKFANNVAGNLNVRDVIVLAQEFYDEVARRIAEVDESREVPVENYKPTLANVLRVLSDAE